VIGGQTTEQGVTFVLKNNKDTMPVELTVIAQTTPIHLSAFKDEGPFLQKDTDASGRLTIKFRTGEDMHFRLTGASGATYQLSVWRGPEIRLAKPDPVVSMSSVVPPSGSNSGPQPKPPSGDGAADGGGGGPGIGIYLLLGGIFVALLGIAFLIYRGQTMVRKP
jgi:hypothetical protein